MANIKDRIKKINEYFQEFQIVTSKNGDQLIYVKVKFPRNWIVDDDISTKYSVTIGEGTSIGEFYFCADIEIGEEEIFDAIDYSVDKMKSAIERANLLHEKTLELKALFEDENITLEQLRNLKFEYKEEKPIFPSKQNKKHDKEKSEKAESTESLYYENKKSDGEIRDEIIKVLENNAEEIA